MGEYAEMYDDYNPFDSMWRVGYDPDKPRVLVLIGDFAATIHFSFYPGSTLLTKIKKLGGVYDPKAKSWMMGLDHYKSIRLDLMKWAVEGFRVRKADSDFEQLTKAESEWLNWYADKPDVIAPSEVVEKGDFWR